MKKLSFNILSVIIIILTSGCYNVSVPIPQEFVDNAKVNNYPILITKVKVSYPPSSVGGVDLFLSFKNISDKTIKYAVFSVEAFNAVNDPVRCSIRNEKYAVLKITGAIRPSEFYGLQKGWGNVWYNSTIRYATIKNVSITFMDNLTLDFDGRDLQNMMYAKRSIF